MNANGKVETLLGEVIEEIPRPENVTQREMHRIINFFFATIIMSVFFYALGIMSRPSNTNEIHLNSLVQIRMNQKKIEDRLAVLELTTMKVKQ